MSFFDWPPASAFYFLQGLTLLALWIAVRLGSGVDFFQLSEKLSNTALIPSWMPRRTFLLLVSKEVYRVAAYSTIPWFFLAAWVEANSGYNLWVRGGCSIAVTLFQLGDSCRTTSHRDYLMIYISWAMLISSEFGETAAYGLCVLYILGSGLAKLRIGGGFRWSSPETLRSILGTFAHKTPKQGGPILAFANRFVRKHDWICGFLGFTTLLFECLLAPLMAFFLPPQWRLITVGLGMVLLHLGIGALQSGAIGAFFLPNLAAYVVGFGDFRDGNDLRCFSLSWCLAFGICFLPLSLAAMRKSSLIKEDWPWTPFALFPWSGSQWNFLHAAFVVGDTRLVTTSANAPRVPSLVGARVIPIEHRSDLPLMQRCVGPQEGETLVLYDLWSRTLGITTYQDEVMLYLKSALNEHNESEELASPLLGTGTGRSESISNLPCEKRMKEIQQSICHLTTQFLVDTHRVLEVSSGLPLERCFLVRVNQTSHVEEVVMEGVPSL